MSFNGHRVLIVYQACFPLPILSAGDRRVSDIACGLSNIGCQTTLLCPSHFEGMVKGDFSYQIRHLGMDKHGPTFQSRRAFWKDVVKFASQYEPSMSLFYNTSIDSMYAIRRVPSPAFELCDLHSVSPHAFHRRLGFFLAEKILPKFTCLNVTISSKIERWLKNTAPRTPTLIVPGLVDTHSFAVNDKGLFRKRFNVSEKSLLVVFSGSWFKQKGIGTLIPAFAQAQKETGVDSVLVVAGKSASPKEEDDPHLIASKHGIEDRVIFPGLLNTKDLAHLLTDADIAVSASTRDPFSELSFPTKVAEFAAMGKAMVLTRVGDLPLYFEDSVNAVFCEPSSVDSMAKSLAKLLSSSELRTILGGRARGIAAQHFNREEAGRKILAALG